MKENTRINALKGIGEKTEQLFSKLGIYTIGDLIRYYPRGYDIYEEPVPNSELEEGKTQTVTVLYMEKYRCRLTGKCR